MKVLKLSKDENKQFLKISANLSKKVDLATDLLHYSTSYAYTVLLTATALLYNTGGHPSKGDFSSSKTQM